MIEVETSLIGMGCIEQILRRLPDLLIIESGGEKLFVDQFVRTIRSIAPRGILKIAAWMHRDDTTYENQLKQCGVDLILSANAYQDQIDFRSVLPVKSTFGLKEPRKVGELIVDSDRYRIWCNHRSLTMTPRQIELLNLFVDNNNKVLTKSYIRDRMNIDNTVKDTSIKAAVIRIRNIIYKMNCGVSIRTISGVGYIMEISR